MLDNVDNELFKEMIIEMNKILKRNTSDEENPRYNVGGFKVISNMIRLVNIINTTAPEDVEKEIDELLLEYNFKTGMTRLKKLIELLYFKGKINNKYVTLELSNDKEITTDFTIILSIAL